MVIPYLIGLAFILVGWFLSITYIGFSAIQTGSIKWKIPGLVLILIGAYIPPIWSRIRGRGD
jgi:hypothetical protein